MPDRMQARLAASRALDWMVNAALPLWGGIGFDCQYGRFEERLTLSATRLPEVPIRLMTQARQIYVFALAARRGWYPDAMSLVERAYASMRRDYYRPETCGGWIFSIRRDGEAVDSRLDFYAHAFVLLAISSYVTATGNRQALSLADATLAAIDRHLGAPETGGFLESYPPGDVPRRQNPHMHMFEALLALYSCSRDPKYLSQGKELLDLFVGFFFRRDCGVLGEFFNARLEPAGGVQGKLVEPGHHYEWIWLLRWYERLSGQKVQYFVDALYNHADTFGYDHDGLVVDELLLDGSQWTRSRRTWPMTEAIKANIVEAVAGRNGAAEKAVRLTELLLQRFLLAGPSGGWIDRLDEEGKASTDFIPASTFYHVACAIDELDRFSTLASSGR